MYFNIIQNEVKKELNYEDILLRIRNGENVPSFDIINLDSQRTPFEHNTDLKRQVHIIYIANFKYS